MSLCFTLVKLVRCSQYHRIATVLAFEAFSCDAPQFSFLSITKELWVKTHEGKKDYIQRHPQSACKLSCKNLRSIWACGNFLEIKNQERWECGCFPDLLPQTVLLSTGTILLSSHTLNRGVSIGPFHVNLILHGYLGTPLAVRIFSKLLPLGDMREHPSQVVFAPHNRWKVTDSLKQ